MTDAIDAMRWPRSYTEAPQPAPVHAACGHPRTYGAACRFCAPPLPSLQDEARWRDADYARRLREQDERRRR